VVAIVGQLASDPAAQKVNSVDPVAMCAKERLGVAQMCLVVSGRALGSRKLLVKPAKGGQDARMLGPELLANELRCLGDNVHPFPAPDVAGYRVACLTKVGVVRRAVPAEAMSPLHAALASALAGPIASQGRGDRIAPTHPLRRPTGPLLRLA
jgi:hypothetical protein